MVSLLKDEYVDPIEDDTKLALGAIRGMVSSLCDLHSRFMDKEAFAVFKKNLNGDYEGIGAEFALKALSPTTKPMKPGARPNPGTQATEPPLTMEPGRDARSIPVLEVTAVVPGGPADKAGI